MMTSMLTRRNPRSAVPAPDERPAADARSIPVAFKTPMSARPMIVSLDRGLTLTQALRAIRLTPPGDANAQRLVQQAERETSGPHDYLVLDGQGTLTRVDPEATTLGDIAVPREVRTPRGVEAVPTAAFEVQAYAPVGAAS